MSEVLVSVADGVATVTLNRPEAMNSIDPAMRARLKSLWGELHMDDAVRAIVLTGAGDRAFCTGSDLKRTMPPKEQPAELIFGRPVSDHLVAGLTTDKPLIAAINGYAFGGGLELALACDLRIASDNAQFGLTEVKVGSIPGAGGTQRLPRAMGAAMANYMLLTGARIDAATALRTGLVSHVLPPAELVAFARETALAIAGNAPLSVRAVKRLVRQGADMPLDSAIENERHVFALLRDTADRIEGRRAFAEKRKPVYQGR